MSEQEFAIRFQSLQLANAHPNQEAETVVERAKLYAAFLTGDVASEPAATDEKPSTVSPGVKRTRRTKEQIAADEAKETAPVEEVKTPEAVPTVEYKTLQIAVMKLVQTKGKEAAMKVLEGLGVKTALEFHPDQYASALEAVEAATNEEEALA